MAAMTQKWQKQTKLVPFPYGENTPVLGPLDSYSPQEVIMMKHRGGVDSWPDHYCPDSHSKKNCWCGGHNAVNVKRNLHHHGTKARFLVRCARQFKIWFREEFRRSDFLAISYGD